MHNDLTMHLNILYLTKYLYRNIPERLRDWINNQVYSQWLNNNKYIPPPHIVKQKTIQKYQQQYQCLAFIETGTYLGDMVFAVKDLFKTIYSIEIDKTLARYALFSFRTYPHISIVQGDSANTLKRLVSQQRKNTLFWLDGHYSGGITGKGQKNCPILEELDAILGSTLNHVVLIDDAHCFIGKDDYPTLLYLKQYIRKRRPNFSVSVEDNIIRVVKK